MQPQQSQAVPKQSPKEFFEQAKRLLASGDVWGASQRTGMLRAYFPEDPPILALHGYVLARLGAYGAAIVDMKRSSDETLKALSEGEEENPNRPRIVDQYIRLQSEIGRCMAKLGHPEAGIEEIDRALEMDPDRADAVAARAEVDAMNGDVEGAFARLDDAFARKLEELPITIAEARILTAMDDPDQARLEQSVKRLTALSEEVGMLAGDLSLVLRALGDVLDRKGDFDDAFRAYRRAGKLRRSQYEPGAHAKLTNALINRWTGDSISKLMRPEGKPGARRVIILGTPCSGMGICEDLLGSLPDASQMGAVETLWSLVQRNFKIANGPIRGIVTDPTSIRGEQLRAVAEGYGKESDRIARGADRITIDRNPYNIGQVGLAAAAMEGLCVINCRRDPVAHTLALLCDELPGNHPYANDPIAAASYVRDLERLMDHWRDTLSTEAVGAKVIDIEHDAIANDPKGTLNAICDAFGFECPSDVVDALEPTTARGPSAHPDEYSKHIKAVREFFGS